MAITVDMAMAIAEKLWESDSRMMLDSSWDTSYIKFIWFCCLWVKIFEMLIQISFVCVLQLMYDWSFNLVV